MPGNAFTDGFNDLDRDLWVPSGHAIGGSWIDTAWSSENISTSGGQLRLELNDDDRAGKSYTGGELRSDDKYGYGRYDVKMQASSETGTVSTFFIYTGTSDGRTNEIDIELTGENNDEVHLAFHNSGYSWTSDVKLPFDSADGMHTYTIDWQPGKITFYADGKFLDEVTNSKVPDMPGHIFMSLWTGLEEWLGEANFTETSARYDTVSYDPNGGGPTPAPAPAPEPAPVTGGLEVRLVNAATGALITELTDGTAVDARHAGTPLAIEVRPTGELGDRADSMRFDLSGAASAQSTENIVPYSLFGDDDSGLNGRVLGSGLFSLDIDVFDLNGAAGQQLASETIDFSIGSGIRLELVNAGTNQTIRELKDGDRIEGDDMPDSLSIRAVANGAESVVFDIDGPIERTQTENLLPYALFGDDMAGDYHGRAFGNGSYSLDVSAYDENQGRGALVAAEVVDFVIV